MYLKNTVGQHIPFLMVKAADGTALTGATVTVKRCLDGAAQAAVTGTVTEKAGGQYDFAASQADTNADTGGFLFTATSAIPLHITVAFSNPAAAQVGANVIQLGGTNQTARDVGAQLDATVSSRSTYAGADTAGTTTLLGRIPGTVAAQTGDAFARLGAPAGASHAADVAAVKVDTAAVKVQTDKMAFTVANKIDANTLAISSTAQTGRDLGAGVLISPGTGAGQLDVTSGVIKANLVQILATALTETAGYLAAGFKKFFNVAVPAHTVASVDQTGDSYARLGAPGNGTVSADASTFYIDVKSTLNLVKAQTDKLAFTVANKVDANVLAVGGTAQTAKDLGASATQTGDSFARLGAPVGASHSADVAAVKADTGGVRTDYTTARAAKLDNLDATVSSRLAPAGTLAVVTNLTNAPTAGDLTATMKASVAAAVPTGAVIADAVWDEATSGHTTAGTAGKALTDAGAAGTPPSAAAIADAVWDEPIAGHLTAGTTGVELDGINSNASTLIGRIPGTVQPQTGDSFARLGAPVGASHSADVAAVKADTGGVRTDYTTARAAKLDNLDATVSSRLAPAGTLATVTSLTNAPTAGDLTAAMKASVTAAVPNIGAIADGVWDEALSGHAAAGSSGIAVSNLSTASHTAADTATAVWGAGSRSLTSFGTLVADIATAVWGAATRTLSAFGFSVAVSDKTGFSLSTPPPTAATIADAVLDEALAGHAAAGSLGDYINVIAVRAHYAADAATAVWAAGARTLTSFGTLAADTATTVWGAGARSLTTFGTLVADAATGVWGAASRTLSAFGFSVAVADKTGFSLATPPPTEAVIADKLLGRSLAGGADGGGHTVGNALRMSGINKIVLTPLTSSTATLTLYAEDGTTVVFTRTVTLDPEALPIVGMGG